MKKISADAFELLKKLEDRLEREYEAAEAEASREGDYLLWHDGWRCVNEAIEVLEKNELVEKP